MANKKEVGETEFTKEQFLKSKTYGKYRDLLTVLLDDNKTYSKEQVDNIIRKAGK